MDRTIRVIRSEQEIKDRVLVLAEEIRASTPSGELTVVGILDDAFVFLADLIRAVRMPLNCSFMKVERHRHGGQTEVMFTSELDPRGCDVLLVDGVAATGITLDYVTRHIAERGVRSLRTCVLVDKPSERRVDLKPDFIAFQSDDGYVFGYGLGMQNHFRQLPHLAVIED